MSDDGFFRYRFAGPIERISVGKKRPMTYSVLMLPPWLANELGERPARFRIVGELGEATIAGAFVPSGDGRRHLMTSPRVLKEAGLSVGSIGELRFNLDDPGRVECSPDIEVVRAHDPVFEARWLTLSPGRQRAVTYYVQTARTAATRRKRLEEIRDVVLHHGGDFRKWSAAAKERMSP